MGARLVEFDNNGVLAVFAASPDCFIGCIESGKKPLTRKIQKFLSGIVLSVETQESQ